MKGVVVVMKKGTCGEVVLRMDNEDDNFDSDGGGGV